MLGLYFKVAAFGLLTVLSVTGLQAEEWSKIRGEDKLIALVSGATAFVELSPGGYCSTWPTAALSLRHGVSASVGAGVSKVSRYVTAL